MESFFRKSDGRRRQIIDFLHESNVDQGEVKKIGFAPLFSLNHTYAMLRANINRLIRKTWCATKASGSLKDHIDLYFEKKDLDFNTPAGLPPLLISTLKEKSRMSDRVQV